MVWETRAKTLVMLTQCFEKGRVSYLESFSQNLYFTFVLIYVWCWVSQVALVVKNMPPKAGDAGNESPIPGPEDPLEKGMATHSSILAWRIPWIEEPGGLQSIVLQRVRHAWNVTCVTILANTLIYQWLGHV